MNKNHHENEEMLGWQEDYEWSHDLSEDHYKDWLTKKKTTLEVMATPGRLECPENKGNE